MNGKQTKKNIPRLQRSLAAVEMERRTLASFMITTNLHTRVESKNQDDPP